MKNSLKVERLYLIPVPTWDDLIEEVEKIEKIYHPFHGYFGVHISSNNCTIQGTKLRLTEPTHYAYFADHTAETKYDAVRKAIEGFWMFYKTLNKEE